MCTANESSSNKRKFNGDPPTNPSPSCIIHDEAGRIGARIDSFVTSPQRKKKNNKSKKEKKREKLQRKMPFVLRALLSRVAIDAIPRIFVFSESCHVFSHSDLWKSYEKFRHETSLGSRSDNFSFAKRASELEIDVYRIEEETREEPPFGNPRNIVLKETTASAPYFNKGSKATFGRPVLFSAEEFINDIRNIGGREGRSE